MKVLFDTCVVVDIFGKSKFFFDSYCAYDSTVARGFSPCLSVSSTTDICYLLHTRGFCTGKEAAQLTEKCLDLFDLVDNIGQDCKMACQGPMRDYEDALISASAYRTGVDLIVTRNTKDFKASPIATMTPKDFVKTYKPEGVNYDEIDFE